VSDQRASARIRNGVRRARMLFSQLEVIMIRLLLISLLATVVLDAHASSSTCSIAGTAYDYSGQALPATVVRLIDRETHQASYRATDANAKFEFADLSLDASGQRYRLDMLSPAVVVTGTHIRTRSVVGVAPTFACSGDQIARVDVKAEVR
jgi:hypothetical protein